jgi:hypothetical protein
MKGNMSKSYDAAFRCATHDPNPVSGGDALPGKQIAEELSEALSRLGMTPVGVFCEEPFWAVRVPEGASTVDVLVYVYHPDRDWNNAVWAVSIESTQSSMFGVLKREESPTRTAIVRAVDSALQSVPHVRDIRWFRGLPASPYGTDKFLIRPFG